MALFFEKIPQVIMNTNFQLSTKFFLVNIIDDLLLPNIAYTNVGILFSLSSQFDQQLFLPNE
jgi:hypothetical protein